MEKKEYDSPLYDRNPSPPPELLRHHGDLVHADNVGGSTFSKHWVFSLLMKLIETVDSETSVPSKSTSTSVSTSDTRVAVNGAGDSVSSDVTASASAEQDGCRADERGEKYEGTRVADDGNAASRLGDADAENSMAIDIDDALQTDLCKLWDMSMDQDVCRFLHDYRTLDILTGIITRTRAPRVAEICTGIVANMACVAEICEALAKDDKLVDMFVTMLDTRDAPTLNEVVRLLHTCVSNHAAYANFLTSLRAAPETMSHIVFILTSSTHINLLKNTGELIDTILDRDMSVVDDCASSDFINGLLEAIQQLRSVGERVDGYMHVLQLLSTSDLGVDALISQADRLHVTLQKYLDYICEFDLVDIQGREETLASVLAVFNVLFSSSSDVATNCLESEIFIHSMLKIMESIERTSRRTEVAERTRALDADLATDSEKESPSRTDQNGRKTKNDAAQNVANDVCNAETGDKEIPSFDKQRTAEGPVKHIMEGSEVASVDECLPVTNSSNKRVSPTSLHDDAIEGKRVSMTPLRSVNVTLLYDIVQGFVVDVVSLLPASHEDKENNDRSAHPLLVYLETQCSRERLSVFIRFLRESAAELVTKIEAESKHHELDRLLSVIDEYRPT